MIDITISCQRRRPATAIIFIILLLSAGNGFCEDVTQATARQVAQHQLTRHIALYGHWNHTDAPSIADAQVIYHEGDPVAYNFSIDPSGHILVAVDDAFSPVLLYSTTSSLDTNRIDAPNSIESWIIPELGHQVHSLKEIRDATTESTTRALPLSEAAQRISAAWQLYTHPDASGNDADSISRSLSGSGSSTERGATATVGPFLNTTWEQYSPYNQQAPANSCSGGENTLAGCVAIAWSQLMHYWQWPQQGVGSYSYTWNGQTLGANFEETLYDWDNMPADLDADSSAAEKTAVSTLIYHVAIAAETDFGCSTSGSLAWADDVLDVYFRYKSTMIFNDRSSFASASDWFALLKAELDADPPRPVILSIYTTSGGHEVVVDGYQTDDSTTDMVHINFGWSGYSDTYYDISGAFSAGGYTWNANEQYAVTGIEPDYENSPRVSSSSGDGGGGCFLGILIFSCP